MIFNVSDAMVYLGPNRPHVQGRSSRVEERQPCSGSNGRSSHK